MERIIKIDGEEVGFRASALTPRLYRHKIGRDMVQDLNRLRKAYGKAVEAAGLTKPGADAKSAEVEAYEQAVRDAQMDVVDLEIFENAAYIMAKQYDASLPATPEEWLDDFGTFSVYEVLPVILELWGANQYTTANPKKK